MTLVTAMSLNQISRLSIRFKVVAASQLTSTHLKTQTIIMDTDMVVMVMVMAMVAMVVQKDGLMLLCPLAV